MVKLKPCAKEVGRKSTLENIIPKGGLLQNAGWNVPIVFIDILNLKKYLSIVTSSKFFLVNIR